eukprot:TRINITY_DN3694_c0_g1_i1.p1 TRINITY_DN3694_c0_g1~~TRINITY_DN3694_c0_g1_i1.p1  ORF type:complete len:455 (+),score=148.70 TRINITY_DN3694_c0_g1_i1:70-1365(+)
MRAARGAVLRGRRSAHGLARRCMMSDPDPAPVLRDAGEPHFSGVASQELCSVPQFRERGPFPILRQLLADGSLVEGAEWPLSGEDAVRMYQCMVQSSVYDSVLNEAQRQGRISFYLTAHGEEAASVASAAALQDQDMIYPQYRELPMFLWRGLTVQEVVDACMCNEDDRVRGRCLPVHYVLPERNVQVVKDPLGTHIAQLPGVGYAFRLQGADRVAAAYFGDGAASEGDAPSGFNFAAVLGSQALFICRNNGYAISTPVSQQYAGDGICARAAAFDIPACRVDGNDAVAVYNATAAARRLVVQRRGPVLLELMTYRVSHHSTSDDSTAYRSGDDIAFWREHSLSPIVRFRRALESRQLWDDKAEQELRLSARRAVREAIKAGGQKLRPDPVLMFEDTYDTMPPGLVAQHKEMRRHVAAHRDAYNCNQYRGM